MTKTDTTRQDRNTKKKDKNGKTYGSQKHIRQQEALRSPTTTTKKQIRISQNAIKNKLRRRSRCCIIWIYSRRH